ncbi:MAG: phenylalanine--tRNA ligase subunit alpha [Candidatus Taylorbacteria bacterium]|nr:phenylalanine--tRNA ligase subunit alpha [Candidatus Taylorbacteria bacterium]
MSENESKNNLVGVIGAEGKGHLHPLTEVRIEINRIFAKMGFEIAESPEIETEYNNFDGLRVAKDHPSRDMQDTFWLHEKDTDGNRLLPRTHTSGAQIRFPKKFNPPFKFINPGKVFRNEATDATHEAEFYQVEGMMVREKVTMADLKGTLEFFAKEFFGPETEIRFRPSYFPFTEPGVEVDVRWKDKWLEVLGGGLTHPEVLEAGGLDPKKWQGFAFGMGLDRMVMLKYGIDDIRQMYNGDLRLVNQF